MVRLSPTTPVTVPIALPKAMQHVSYMYAHVDDLLTVHEPEVHVHQEPQLDAADLAGVQVMRRLQQQGVTPQHEWVLQQARSAMEEIVHQLEELESPQVTAIQVEQDGWQFEGPPQDAAGQQQPQSQPQQQAVGQPSQVSHQPEAVGPQPTSPKPEKAEKQVQQ